MYFISTWYLLICCLNSYPYIVILQHCEVGHLETPSLPKLPTLSHHSCRSSVVPLAS